MFHKSIAVSVLALSLAVSPAERVEADAGDFVAGAIIGGLVSHAATKEAQRKKRTTTYRKTYRSRLPSTQEGRQIQASLNYFGFNAGTVDGQLGSRSRAAISSYQAYMGYPATGYLDPFQQNLLTTSYNRAQAGGYTTTQLIAQNPEGVRGLLKTYRAELSGQPVVPQTPYVTQPQTTVVVTPQAPVPSVGTTTTTTVVATPTPPKVVTPAEDDTATTTVAAATAAAPTLPTFLGGGSQQSLASHCNTVSLLTNSNGGFTTVAAMSDPNQALNEQFCLARTYAIAGSESAISKVQGFTPDQIAGQCEGFGPAMKDYVSALSLKSMQEVRAEVSDFILSTGMSPDQLKGTAQICLGVGYRTDNMDVAIGSALLLDAMGQGVYAELMGHHLSQGFGTAKRADMARVWYDHSLQAVDAGADAVFAPGQPERTELLRKASMTLGVNSSAVPTAPQVQPASALPTFTVKQ
ncbi:MAG: peptidoglycan-binding domain-containing protein [Pseudomonadota bacterium]